MKRKKIDHKLNLQLFDTSKYERIFSIPQEWFRLLSNQESGFLKDLLNDVNYIDINTNQIKISFRLTSSYNLFKMSMNNPKSKKIIENIFKSNLGEDIKLLVIRPIKN